MVKIIKSILRKVLSKYAPKFVDYKAERKPPGWKAKELPEWVKETAKELANEARGKEVILYIDGKEMKRSICKHETEMNKLIAESEKKRDKKNLGAG